MRLTQGQMSTLAAILMQHCEDCDTSSATARKVDRIWKKIQAMNKGES